MAITRRIYSAEEFRLMKRVIESSERTELHLNIYDGEEPYGVIITTPLNAVISKIINLKEIGADDWYTLSTSDY